MTSNGCSRSCPPTESKKLKKSCHRCADHASERTGHRAGTAYASWYWSPWNQDSFVISMSFLDPGPCKTSLQALGPRHEKHAIPLMPIGVAENQRVLQDNTQTPQSPLELLDSQSANVTLQLNREQGRESAHHLCTLWVYAFRPSALENALASSPGIAAQALNVQATELPEMLNLSVQRKPWLHAPPGSCHFVCGRVCPPWGCSRH